MPKPRTPLDSVRVQLPVWATDDDLARHAIEYLPEDIDARDVWPALLRHLDSGARSIERPHRGGRPPMFAKQRILAAVLERHASMPEHSYLAVTDYVAQTLGLDADIEKVRGAVRRYARPFRWS